MNRIVQLKRDEDIEVLAILARKIWFEYFGNLLSYEHIEYMVNKFQSYDALKDAINNDNYVYFAIYNDNEMAGYISLQCREEELFLSKYYVDKNYRGLGYGKALMNKTKEYAKLNNLNKIGLTCYKQNFNSLNLYEHYGFKIIDSTVTNIGNNFVMDDYVLLLNINE